MKKSVSYMASLAVTALWSVVGLETAAFGYNAYIFGDSDVRCITREETREMTAQEVCIAKNEIYARHGRQFLSAELRDYFQQQDWYLGSVAPEQFDASVFNENENYNIAMLSEVEQALTGGGYGLDKPGYEVVSVLEKYEQRNGAMADGMQPGQAEGFTEELAYHAVYRYLEDCGVDFATVAAYNGYLIDCGMADGVYTFDFRSYTGTHAFYYADPVTGEVMVSEQNGLTMEYEPAVYAFSMYDYLGEGTAAEETSALYADGSAVSDELIADMLSGTVTPLGSWFTLDLDGDGAAEQIRLNGEGYDPRDDYFIRYDLAVNDSICQGSGDCIANKLFGVSLDGKTILLITEDYGPSDDPVSAFYRYSNGTLSAIGSINDWTTDLRIDEGYIYAALDCRAVETARMRTIWTLDAGGSLVQVPQEVYEYASYDDDRVLMLLRPLTVYEQKNLSSADGILVPQQVRFTYTDGKDWVYVQAVDGSGGWMNLEGLDSSTLNTYFSGLLWAD